MSRKLTQFITLMVLCLGLSGCGNLNYAPVTDAQLQDQVSRGIHRVRKGETLYAIAWLYDTDYRELAAINHLRKPYRLRIGQKLRISSPKTPARKAVARKQTKVPKVFKRKVGIKSRSMLSKKHKPRNTSTVKGWRWPTRGKIIRPYSPQKHSKGIDIAGRPGQAIHAAAPGTVAYSGSGIRGYGNLLIIKHNDEYLSAYAHNRRLLVKEGEHVKTGMKIAEMGRTGSPSARLHFEIRKAGRPVDPMAYLSRK